MPVWKGVFSDGTLAGVRTVDGTTLVSFVAPLSVNIFGSRDMQTLMQVDATSVYRSTDGGDNWSLLSAIPSAGVAALQLATGTIIVQGDDDAVNGQRVFRSTNGGSSWSTIVVHGTNVVEAADGVLHETSNGTILLGCATAASTGRIYQSTDDGVTWTHVYTNPNFLKQMAIGQHGSTICLLHNSGTSTVIERSTNHGTTWSTRYTSAGGLGTINTVRNGPAYLESASRWLYFTSHNVGYHEQTKHYSDDDGLNWSTTTSADVTIGSHQGGIIATDTSTLFAVMDVSGFEFQVSTTGGDSWTDPGSNQIFMPASMQGAFAGPTAMTPATPAGIGLEIEIAPARIQLLRENYKPVIRIY